MLEYPIDYGTVDRAGHCGVLAVAICAKVPFETAWKTIVTHGGRGRTGRWKGGTSHHERTLALQALGVAFEDYQHVPAAHLPHFTREYIERHGLRPACTAAGFAARYAKPGVTYMLRVGGHVLTLRDGMLADQSGIAPASQHLCARKRVTRSTVILGA